MKNKYLRFSFIIFFIKWTQLSIYSYILLIKLYLTLIIFYENLFEACLKKINVKYIKN